MRLYQDEAVVLRLHKLGEADRIVTLLTRNHGLVRAVAKGIRRTRSKFGARLDLFVYADLTLHRGRDLDIITSATTRNSHASIATDYGRYTAACAILETAERIAGEERLPVPQLHGLTVAALGALALGERPAQHVLDAYLLRAMDIAGWMPTLEICGRCGNGDVTLRAFDPASGGAVCVHCRPFGAKVPAAGVLELLDALYRGRWGEVAEVTENQQGQASSLIEAHLQWHLQRSLRSLPLVERDLRRDSVS